MAGFYGADVEQLQQLARDLDVRAEELNQITSRLTTKVASVAWKGPDAQRFTTDWNERLSVELRKVSTALVEISGHVRVNARDQESTSRGASGVSDGGGSLGSIPGEPADPAPPWPSMSWGAPELFRGMSRLIERPVGTLPWNFGDFGQYVPFVGTALDVTAVADKLSHGQVPVHEMVSTAAGALRESPVPAVYLVGVAMGVWNQVAEKAIATDWSPEQFKITGSFIGDHPAEALDAAAQAVVSYLPDLFSNFKK